MWWGHHLAHIEADDAEDAVQGFIDGRRLKVERPSVGRHKEAESSSGQTVPDADARYRAHRKGG